MAMNIKTYDKTLEIVEEIYGRLEKNESTSSIIKDLVNRLKISEITVRKHIQKAYELLDKRADKNVETLIRLHCERYEDIYQQNRQRIEEELRKAELEDDEDDFEDLEDNEDTKPKKKGPRKYIINGCNIKIIEALWRKEKVLGFHKKKFNIQVNNNKTIEKKPPSDKYDFSKLTLQEKIELRSLLEKSKEGYQETISKTTEIVVVSQVPKTKGNYEIIDVVGKIQPEITEAEVIESNIIDLTGGAAEHNKTITEVGKTLKDAIQKQIEEALKRKKK